MLKFTTFGNATIDGDVKKDGVAIGTLYLDALGGAIVTVEGNTINVTAPQ